MENNFWTDELVAEFGEFYRKKQGVDFTTWGKCILDAFKKSKEVNPDYKIRSFIYGGDVFKKDVDGLFKNDFHPDSFSEGRLTQCKFPIHSVERADGEIFCLGDYSEYNSFGVKGITIKVAKIESFGMNDGEVWAYGKDGGFIAPLRNLKKPKYAFTSEDGVDIFEGQTFYEVSANDWAILAESRRSEDSHRHFYKYFSTKEAAEEYVKLNQPITICLKDFIQSLKVPSNDTLGDIELVFKQIINL